jgi:Protein of unknown function DUF262
MIFETHTWPISELIRLYDADKLNLSPPYQRNPVWTAKAQQKLLQSILSGKPIPNFFLLKTGEGSYEMIDGQQRARTILGYSRNLITDHENLTFEKRIEQSQHRKQTASQFLDYKLSITVVKEIHDNESIEEYYALLNSSGLRLSRPELKKAEYFTTNFLKLVLECAKDEKFSSLRMFKESSSARMNDVDFVSELIALLKFGISDKKEKVDQLYEDDINLTEYRSLKRAFDNQMIIFNRCNHITPLIRTRYKQKNDFYSVFYLFWTVKGSHITVLEHLYKVLVKVGPHIRPSQTECEPLREYAHHCVTQSNSKASRQARHDILVGLLLNLTSEPTPVQEAVLDYFRLSANDLIQVGDYWTLDPSKIHDPHNFEFAFDENEI